MLCTYVSNEILLLPLILPAAVSAMATTSRYPMLTSSARCSMSARRVAIEKFLLAGDDLVTQPSEGCAAPRRRARDGREFRRRHGSMLISAARRRPPPTLRAVRWPSRARRRRARRRFVFAQAFRDLALSAAMRGARFARRGDAGRVPSRLRTASSRAVSSSAEERSFSSAASRSLSSMAF